MDSIENYLSTCQSANRTMTHTNPRWYPLEWPGSRDALDSLSLHRMRGEGRGEGLREGKREKAKGRRTRCGTFAFCLLPYLTPHPAFGHLLPSEEGRRRATRRSFGIPPIGIGNWYHNMMGSRHAPKPAPCAPKPRSRRREEADSFDPTRVRLLTTAATSFMGRVGQSANEEVRIAKCSQFDI